MERIRNMKAWLSWSALIAGSIGLLISVALGPTAAAFDPGPPVLYLFWSQGCPHCQDEKEFLTLLHEQYPALEMRWFEVFTHPQFARLADALRKAYGEKLSSVPMTFIGEHVIVGFQSFEQTGLELEALVNECLEQGCGDPFDRIADHPLAPDIKQQAADRQPEGWELFPATARSAPDTTSSQ